MESKCYNCDKVVVMEGGLRRKRDNKIDNIKSLPGLSTWSETVRRLSRLWNSCGQACSSFSAYSIMAET